MLKSIEKQFIADESQKRANEVMQIPLDYLLSSEPKMQTPTKVDFVVEKVDEKPPPAPKKAKKSKVSELEPYISVYAMLFCERYKPSLSEHCNGCLFSKLTPDEHNVCMMMKKSDRINLVFDHVMSQLTDELILQKLHEMKVAENVDHYLNKNTLLASVNFIKRLKTRLDKYT